MSEKLQIQEDIQVNFAQSAGEVAATKCISMWQHLDGNTKVTVKFQTTVAGCVIKAEATLGTGEGDDNATSLDVKSSIEGAAYQKGEVVHGDGQGNDLPGV